MAGVGVSSSDFGSTALRRLERQIRAAASRRRMRLLLDGLAGVGEETTRGRILRGGPAPDGQAWAPPSGLGLSARKPLNASGLLAATLASRVSGRAARWGSNRVYARIHQLGGVVIPRRRRALHFDAAGRPIFVGKVVIPPRPFVGWGGDEENAASALIRRWMAEALGGRA